MIKPVRLQLSRKKGFNLQTLSLVTNGLPAVNCARPGKWGNPFRFGVGEESETAADAVIAFRYIFEAVEPICESDKALRGCIQELRGKNLACWCKVGDPCHADVLLELANR
jgi:hypothetical protein